MTPDEIRELDEYCRERFIDLVPAVGTLGHMGRILSMPRYRRLAEIEPSVEWFELGWPERARGFTLDIANPESWTLVERIWTEILDAFSSPVVNICGDEPWDLGKGKNRERWSAKEAAEAYIDHVVRTHDLCAARGRRTQVWSDVVRNHPEQLDRLPKDLAVLHWGYDDRADYAGTSRFAEAGLSTIVCPGTSGWKRIINALGLAERNISTFASVGKGRGASGLLNTDWGDHGHFNALACSWHGIALGAAKGWRADHPEGPAFDALFARHMTAGGESDAEEQASGVVEEAIRHLREASRLGDSCETWRLLWQPAAKAREDSSLPTIEEAERAAEAARLAACRLERIGGRAFADRRARGELLVACRFTELFAERVIRIRSGSSRHSDRATAELHSWGERFAMAAEAFAGCWRARNKPSGLADILSALDRVRLESAPQVPDVALRR